MSQDSNSLLAKDFIGLAVYSPDKLKIGTINDLILSKDGKTVEGFVIGVGGFLGIGEKAVALKMDRLQISNTAEGAVAADHGRQEGGAGQRAVLQVQARDGHEKRAAETPRNTPTRPSTNN